MKRASRKLTFTAIALSAVGLTACAAEKNVPTVVYGPPPEMETSAEYTPGDNAPDEVYGPPEMLKSAETTETIGSSGENGNRNMEMQDSPEDS